MVGVLISVLEKQPPGSRLIGVRECFTPRPGFLYVSADFSGLELCTLAQVCLDLFGWSRLAEALNAGEDPHLSLACEILGITYEEGKSRKKAKDPAVDQARQTAKVGNFGFPGGLGAVAFQAFAWSNYRVRVTIPEAKRLKALWLRRWPEMSHFFDYVNQAVNSPSKTIRQVRSNRLRGGLSFCDGCNTLFQGLGADAATAAHYAVTKACYAIPDSPLYGSKPVNFVHDETILESPEDRAQGAARELSRVMVEEAKIWLPGVKIKAEPTIARRWSKQAESHELLDGSLSVWCG